MFSVFFTRRSVSSPWSLESLRYYDDYSNSFTLSNASELFWPGFLRTIFKFRGRKNLVSRRLFKYSIKREIRHFPVVVVQWRKRNVLKRVMHACKVVLPVQSIAFLTFSLSSPSWHLKVTVVVHKGETFDEMLCRFRGRSTYDWRSASHKGWLWMLVVYMGYL